MRRVGQARRRDANERAIVQALEAVGAQVTRISGKGAPDLLVRYKGLYAFEVKSGKGVRTEAQVVSEWPIVRSSAEALHAIGATTTTKISQRARTPGADPASSRTAGTGEGL